MWSVDFEDDALEDLGRLSSPIRTEILQRLEWFRLHFSEIQPRPLGGEWRGLYKFRVGDYRVIYDIHWPSFRLVIVLVDHRSRVYRRKRR